MTKNYNWTILLVTWFGTEYKYIIHFDIFGKSANGPRAEAFLISQIEIKNDYIVWKKKFKPSYLTFFEILCFIMQN